jgi:hypothetical protein
LKSEHADGDVLVVMSLAGHVEVLVVFNTGHVGFFVTAG